MDLYLIDAIGPFFVGYEKRVINWSKIPFPNLESKGGLDPVKTADVLEAFTRFLDRVAELGFNGITLDDIAHLTIFDFYSPALRSKLEAYGVFYQSLFKIAAERGLAVYINSDVMFYQAEIERRIAPGFEAALSGLETAIRQVLSGYPAAGIVLRIGESDGVDVEGDFHSRLLIRTPREANRLIRRLLPIFESLDKKLIFRTWTLGSYPIGDLMWNPKTFDQAFAGIDSQCFIVSMKYGDTDFFGSLKLNPLFFQSSHQKIIELQTRRERDFFGVLPYYVGWDYEAYRHQLAATKGLVGLSVWCQTGGWSRNRQLTFLENSSRWNELNTLATLRIFKEEANADRVAADFLSDPQQLEFLRGFHHLWHRLLYPAGSDERPLYFRRIRIPPQMWFVWDYITVNGLSRSLHELSTGMAISVDAADIDRLQRLGEKLKIYDMEFCTDTLRILLACVAVLSGRFSPAELEERVRAYQEKHPQSPLKFKVDPSAASPRWTGRLLALLLRRQAAYRWVDRLLLTHFFSWLLLRLARFLNRDQLPKYADKRAMQTDILFR